MRHFASICILATCINALPSGFQQTVVPHDSLFPIQDTLPKENLGEIIKRFEPYVHIAHGCQVMTAVNEEGHTSGGLKKAGSPSGGCRYQDRGQTYTRSAWHGGRFAILFAWYWPKDQPRGGKVAGGHRHDWECAVVWLDDPESKTPTLLGAAVSGHGKFKKELNPPKEGDHVKLEYFNTFPLNHEMQFSQTLGKLFPIINWDNMTEQTREALQKTDFGAANVPFKEGAFQNNLQEAMLDIPVR